MDEVKDKIKYIDYKRVKAYEKFTNELKGIRSLRKAAVKILDVNHIVSEYEDEVWMEIGWYWRYDSIRYRGGMIYNNCDKKGFSCFICKYRDTVDYSWRTYFTVFTKKEIEIKYITCKNCINKKLCMGCLRETSRCQQIQNRKTTIWLCLLHHKFPKDIIRLITKKVK